MPIRERLQHSLTDRYRLERELGQGGMATVYLAEDLKHKRQVAIKVLKPELAAVLGAERFVQEITTTAALQHPHILPLFDSGEADGFLYYVMPFIDGETSRAKLDRETQLGVEEAVKIATEVADALHYAHANGVIHRDIKPENILLANGRPMVADFGIALAVSAAAGGRMTETGLSLGTPHYMSPEQATAEKEISARSDVYSLASVLYEMLAGQPPHSGSSAQQIIMKIITEPAPLVTQYRKSVPPHVAAALARALEKLPADRFASAQAFAGALGDPSFRAAGGGLAAAGRRSARTWRDLLPIATTALVVGTATFLAGRQVGSGPTAFDVGLPDTAQLAFVMDGPFGVEWPALSVSPDGDFIVYVAHRGTANELWYRSLVSDEARPLPGTRGGYLPAISPDGRWVAFVDGKVLRKVAVDGGAPPSDVAEALAPIGIEWSGPDELLIAADFGGRTEWVRMSDGVKSRIGGVCGWPTRVPETDDIFCQPQAGVGGAPRIVTLGADGAVPLSATAGKILGDSARPLAGMTPKIVGDHVVFVDVEGNLMAAAYDRKSRSFGANRVVHRGLRRASFGTMGHLDVTRAGDLVYVPGSNGGMGQFVATQPGGTTRILPIPVKEHQNFNVSYDGRRLAASSRGVGGFELWVYDVASGQGDRVASGFGVAYPVWAPDGSLVYSTQPSSADRVWTMLVPPDGTSPSIIPGLTMDPLAFVSRRFLVGSTQLDVTVATLEGDRVVRTDTLKLPNAQYYPVASPDGRWIAYAGAEKGKIQLLVTPFPAMNRQYKVSIDAASEPLWLPDGSLVYRDRLCWYRLRPRPGAVPPLDAPASLFCDEKFVNTPGPSNVSMPDGSLLYLRSVTPTTAGYVRVVRGWVETLSDEGSGTEASK
ncbi:MAG: serine/threonine-protein kinase [Gemmatimonadetes bacterium]|nr:serine/threonine-protein kinase [Gemmatimonadota bacterium]